GLLMRSPPAVSSSTTRYSSTAAPARCRLATAATVTLGFQRSAMRRMLAPRCAAMLARRRPFVLLVSSGASQGRRGDKNMQIGVPRETAAGETRVAATPETVKKLTALGHTVRVESGAGVAASAIDSAYSAVGAEITDRAGAFGCELVLKVRAPNADELRLMR